jgi:hypothetical protein
LDRPNFYKGLLDYAQTFRLSPALVGVLAGVLNGLNLVSIRLDSQHTARIDRLSIQQDRAGPTFAFGAPTKLRAKISFAT